MRHGRSSAHERRGKARVASRDHSIISPARKSSRTRRPAPAGPCRLTLLTPRVGRTPASLPRSSARGDLGARGVRSRRQHRSRGAGRLVLVGVLDVTEMGTSCPCHSPTATGGLLNGLNGLDDDWPGDRGPCTCATRARRIALFVFGRHRSESRHPFDRSRPVGRTLSARRTNLAKV